MLPASKKEKGKGVPKKDDGLKSWSIEANKPGAAPGKEPDAPKGKKGKGSGVMVQLPDSAEKGKGPDGKVSTGVGRGPDGKGSVGRGNGPDGKGNRPKMVPAPGISGKNHPVKDKARAGPGQGKELDVKLPGDYTKEPPTEEDDIFNI